jgi:hypothetical protein
MRINDYIPLQRFETQSENVADGSSSNSCLYLRINERIKFS